MNDFALKLPNKYDVDDRHPFPVIDFKFQNTGTATAFLTEFLIEVNSAEVDVTPALRFDWQFVNSNSEMELSNNQEFQATGYSEIFSSFIISASNFGWGAAKNLQINLCEGPLRQLFPSLTQRTTEIVDDRSSTIYEFSSTDMDKGAFRSLSEAYKEIAEVSQKDFAAQKQLTEKIKAEATSEQELQLISKIHGANDFLEEKIRYFELSMLEDEKYFARISPPAFNWHCCDEAGFQYQGYHHLNWGHGNSSNIAVYISEEGFHLISGDNAAGGAGGPGPTYCALVDPDAGTQIKKYSISRKIESGDVERFHILIGATKSCYLNLKIGFGIDGKSIVYSNNFEVRIRNLRCDRFHMMYRDGQEILEEVTSKLEEEERSRLSRSLSNFTTY